MIVLLGIAIALRPVDQDPLNSERPTALILDDKKCGVNCAYFLLHALGKSADLVTLEKQAPLTDRGMSVENLRRLLLNNGCEAAVLKFQGTAALSQVPKPSILHFTGAKHDVGHYCVLLNSSGGRYMCVDGTTGDVLDEPEGEVLRFWSGDAIVPAESRFRSTRTAMLIGGFAAALLLAMAFLCISNWWTARTALVLGVALVLATLSGVVFSKWTSLGATAPSTALAPSVAMRALSAGANEPLQTGAPIVSLSDQIVRRVLFKLRFNDRCHGMGIHGLVHGLRYVGQGAGESAGVHPSGARLKTL